MATPPILRQLLFHCLRFHHNFQRLTVAPPQRLWCTAATPTTNLPSSSSENAKQKPSSSLTTSNVLLKFEDRRWDNDPKYSKWKVKKDEIVRDISPIITLTKDILHSSRYMDGEHLSVEDEKAVVEKLLAYHPHSEDKIGCGLYSIMVDRHPQFEHYRCLFVVSTDGGWIDFSYRKCLREYLRHKYPAHAERFFEELMKYGMQKELMRYVMRLRKIHQYPT